MDLTFTTESSDEDLTHVEGNTDAGEDFVDSLMRETLTVLDSGHVIVQTTDVAAIQVDAREQGLTMEDQ